MKTQSSDYLWWRYVKKAHQRCYDDFSEDCSKAIHDYLKLDFDATNKCVEESFTNPDHGTGDNVILSADATAWNLHGAHYIPSVIINYVAYRGVLDPENVFAAICNSFADAQEECIQYNDEISTASSDNKDKVSFGVFILIILFLVVLNVGLLLI